MTTFFTILLIHIGATTYTVTLPSQAECSDALLIISDARLELSDMGDGGEVWGPMPPHKSAVGVHAPQSAR